MNWTCLNLPLLWDIIITNTRIRQKTAIHLIKIFKALGIMIDLSSAARLIYPVIALLLRGFGPDKIY
jgi:hypothetical protein